MENSLEAFEKSTASGTPPENYSVYLKALWYDWKGHWNKAHSLIDQLQGKEAARLHAYLHRKEGDESNARYWYRQAGLTLSALSLNAEQEMLIRHFLEAA